MLEFTYSMFELKQHEKMLLLTVVKLNVLTRQKTKIQNIKE